MFNPLRLVDNNFEDKNLSDADLRSFSEDHLVRLTNPDNNPGGIYNTLITDTTTKYNAYYGKITNKAVKKAIAEGTTVTRNNAREAAEKKISNINDLVKYKFLSTSAEYQELYPLGAREYQDAREGDVGTLFDRFVQAATTHLNADFPNEVTAIDDLVDAFHSAYTARETVMSQVDVLITGKNADRLSLTVQLTVNFLIIASNNVSNADKFDDYYDARFLPIETGTGEEGPQVAEADFNSGQVVNLAFTLPANPSAMTILFENPGTSPWWVYAANNISGEPGPGAHIEVLPGGSVTKTGEQLAAELGINAAMNLVNIKNMGATVGHYKVTITE